MLQVRPALVDQTLGYIHEGGAQGCETAVLWLGRRSGGIEIVSEAYRPIQRVRRDLFHIPPEGMRALMSVLREKRLQILAQVHSHPGLAFHSAADNEWAIVRHRNALSFVIPHFGRGCSSATFLQDIAAFQLSADDAWLEVAPVQVMELHDAES